MATVKRMGKLDLSSQFRVMQWMTTNHKKIEQGGTSSTVCKQIRDELGLELAESQVRKLGRAAGVKWSKARGTAAPRYFELVQRVSKLEAAVIDLQKQLGVAQQPGEAK